MLRLEHVWTELGQRIGHASGRGGLDSLTLLTELRQVSTVIRFEAEVRIDEVAAAELVDATLAAIASITHSDSRADPPNAP